MPLPRRISVVGIGKLGLCLAATLASKGFEVTGVDVNEATVESVKGGRSPIYEPGIQELITANRKRLSATMSFEEAVLGTGATFVVVPTPSEENGEFSLRFVTAAMRRVADALRPKKVYHLIVLTSTVLPGSMNKAVKPLLERRSGKELGRDFGLCYSPELIALGEVIKGLLEPDLVLIGESDHEAGKTLAAIKRKLCSNSPPIIRMNFISAEIAKIALNSFVTMKMSFANTLAEICEKFQGADVDVVTNAIGKDSRVGPRNLRGALGYGGPCFPRDNVAFAQFAKKAGAQAELALATHAVNIRQVSRIARIVQSECGRDARISILGLAYKPSTNVLDESQAVLLAKELSKKGHQVCAYDPAVVDGSILQRSVPEVHLERRIKTCLAKADCCVVANPLRELKQIDVNLFSGKTVIDCWRVLPEEVGRVARYIVVGRQGPDRATRKLVESDIPLTRKDPP